jgi:hypothetical protein
MQLGQFRYLVVVSSAIRATLPAGTQPLWVGSDGPGETGRAVVGKKLLYFDRFVSDAERDSITVYLRAA